MSESTREEYDRGVVNNVLDMLRRITNLSTSSLDAIREAIKSGWKLGLMVECPECGGIGERQDADFTLPCWFCLGDGEVALNRSDDWKHDIEQATGEEEASPLGVMEYEQIMKKATRKEVRNEHADVEATVKRDLPPERH